MSSKNSTLAPIVFDEVDRLAIYREALAAAEGYVTFSKGLCSLLTTTIDYHDKRVELSTHYVYYNQMKHHFPEIWKRKPSKNFFDSGYWLSTTKRGWEPRKRLLREAIAELEEKLKS